MLKRSNKPSFKFRMKSEGGSTIILRDHGAVTQG